MEPIRAGDLVACSDPPGPSWLALLERAWAAGAAVLPLEPRLPAATREALLERCRPSIVDGVRVHDEPVAARGLGLVIATSGTTGGPKAVRLSREALRAAVSAGADRLGLDGEPWGCPIPVAHIGGMLVVLRGLLLGVPVSFEPDPAASDAAWSSIVPLQLHRLVASDARIAGRGFLVGGDRLDPTLRAQAEACGAHIVPTYGMTESCGGVVYDGTPLDGVRVTIAADERIVLDGPTLFDGYVGDPDRNGAFVTNDRGRIDEHGTLTVLGRVDDIVIIAGEKIDRGAVEATLRALPGAAAATIGVEADPARGTGLVAHLPPEGPDDASLQAAIRAAHGALAVPRIVRV